MKQNLIVALVLIVVSAASRLVPHVWNVAPVAAAAMLAGAVLPRKWAVAVPLVAMFASDLVIGFYAAPVMLTVYACFAVSALIGAWVKNMEPTKLVAASLASSTFFFLASNFSVWATADWYEKSWSGLALAYTLAIPFFRNTVMGDLIFTGVMFGVWAVANKFVEKQRVALSPTMNTYE